MWIPLCMLCLFGSLIFGISVELRTKDGFDHNMQANSVANDEELLRALLIGKSKANLEMHTTSENQPGNPVPSFSAPNEQSLMTGMAGLANSFALEALQNWYGNSIDKCTPNTGFCKPKQKCAPVEPQAAQCNPNEIFRRENGSCHELTMPNLGMAGTTFQRLVANRYADGCDTPSQFIQTKNNNCDELPPPRLVSTTLSHSLPTVDTKLSLLFTTFAQFVDHDITLTPVFHQKILGAKKTAQPLCCPYKTSSQCDSISVSEFDPFYSDYNVVCLEFVRSLATTTDPACGLGVRLQINQNTHWLDASNVYGSGSSSPKLRSFVGGALIVSKPFFDSVQTEAESEFVPISNFANCLIGNTVNAPCDDNECCVMAGDIRAGEQPPLTSMHALWLRHHNRIARNCILLHGSSSPGDEKCYQLTRKILIAQYQFIVYNELLPAILGQKRMINYELTPLKSNSYLNKDKYVRGLGKIFLEFATAAARFGHSLLNDNIFKTTATSDQHSDTNIESYPLSDHLNSIYLAIDESYNVGNILKGQCSKAAFKMDRHLTGEVQNKLFKTSNPFGNDLFAINIQRGRDHGIGTYYDLRSYCLGDVSVDPSWESPIWDGVFDKSSFNTLKKLYRSPVDVDLFAGGISELPDAQVGGLVGPTFACIIAKQFHSLKFGDRFWFEFGDILHGNKSQFTPEQLREIRKSTLARLMCDLTAVTSVQKNVLELR